MYIHQNQQVALLVRNIVLVNWQAAAHHPELQKETPVCLRRNVSKEFNNYSEYNSVLTETKLDVFFSFSNKTLTFEVEQQCMSTLECSCFRCLWR